MWLKSQEAVLSENPVAPVHTSADDALNFLHGVQRLLSQSGRAYDQALQNSNGAAAWALEDEVVLFEILARFQDWLKVEHVLVIQKITEDFTNVLCRLAVAEDEKPPRELDEMIDSVLDHHDLSIEGGHVRKVFKKIGRSLPETEGDFVFSILTCQIDSSIFGHVGFLTKNELHLEKISRHLTLFTNQLSFWLAHLFLLRKSEVNARMLHQINMTCNVINSNADLGGIVHQLVENLEQSFGQTTGAILLASSETHELEVATVFGTVPEGFSFEKNLGPDGLIQEHISDGSAFNSDLANIDDPIRYIFPLSPMLSLRMSETLGQQSLGGVVLFDVPENRRLSRDAIDLLTILLNGSSASIKIAFNYAEKLETIRSLEGLMNKLSDKDGLISEMIEIIRRVLKVTRISFLTIDESGEYLLIKQGYGLPDGVIESTRIKIGEDISGIVAARAQPYRTDNIESEGLFKRRFQEGYFNKSLLSVPLLSDSGKGVKKVVGVLNVNNKINGLTFTEQDQKMLEAISQVVVSTLDNVSLMKSKYDNEMLNRQLADARVVQASLLPRNFSGRPESIEVSARSIPAREIGGDFFDGLLMGDGRWLSAVGDVSGKGMPAAILMATTLMIFRALARESSDLVTIMKKTDELLSKQLDEYHFVTLQLLAVDPLTGDAATVSAGHGHLLIISNDSVDKADFIGSCPLGITEGMADYTEHRFHLSPNDAVFVYTDGLCEERSPSGEEFGVDRIRELLSQNREKSPEELIGKVVLSSESWRGGRDAHDDLTVLALCFRGKQ